MKIHQSVLLLNDFDENLLPIFYFSEMHARGLRLSARYPIIGSCPTNRLYTVVPMLAEAER